MPSLTASPASGASAGAGVAWADPGNILASDNSRAQSNLTDVAISSARLEATNFFSSLDKYTRLRGIKATTEGFATGTGQIVDNNVRLIVNGSIVGDNNARAGVQWALNNDTIVTYGGSLDNWNLLINGEEAKASDFGFYILAQLDSGTSVAARIDHMQMQIYFHHADPRLASRSRHSMPHMLNPR